VSKEKNSPSVQQILDGLNKLGESFFIVRNRETEERMVLPFNKALRYMVGDMKRRWEVVERIDGEAAKVLYAHKPEEQKD